MVPLHATALLAAFLMTGCILPVPHRRMHVEGLDAKVVDEKSEAPIHGAKVSSSDGTRVLAITDRQGGFKIPPAYGWHGAYLIGPISYSLAPYFDMPSAPPPFRVEASGYSMRTVPPYEELGLSGSDGRATIRLSPE